ncbi:ANTAR domain-containing protein [Pseudonocardia sulfidoxydans]|uniref:ANTAR domain-containing protein n=1 Tax=Pseudonocardia sulfidoxydans TaxID=54011 RepID=UPI001C99DFC1|nr:ANTAR domain-containing protein [Pseudonocardia sulfidoxydans]
MHVPRLLSQTFEDHPGEVCSASVAATLMQLVASLQWRSDWLTSNNASWGIVTVRSPGCMRLPTPGRTCYCGAGARRDREWLRGESTAGDLHGCARPGQALSCAAPGAEQNFGDAALNLYSHAPEALDDAARRMAGLFGLQAGLLLYGVNHARQLSRALDSRDVIGQAKGILMERFGVDLRPPGQSVSDRPAPVPPQPGQRLVPPAQQRADHHHWWDNYVAAAETDISWRTERETPRRRRRSGGALSSAVRLSDFRFEGRCRRGPTCHGVRGGCPGRLPPGADLLRRHADGFRDRRSHHASAPAQPVRTARRSRGLNAGRYVFAHAVVPPRITAGARARCPDGTRCAMPFGRSSSNSGGRSPRRCRYLLGICSTASRALGAADHWPSQIGASSPTSAAAGVDEQPR